MQLVYRVLLENLDSKCEMAVLSIFTIADPVPKGCSRASRDVLRVLSSTRSHNSRNIQVGLKQRKKYSNNQQQMHESFKENPKCHFICIQS
jgi:hypothetical protein